MAETLTIDALPLEVLYHIAWQWLIEYQSDEERRRCWVGESCSTARCGFIPTHHRLYLCTLHSFALTCRSFAAAAKMICQRFADYYVKHQHVVIQTVPRTRPRKGPSFSANDITAARKPQPHRPEVIYYHHLPNKLKHGLWERRRYSEVKGHYIVVERRHYQFGQEHGIREYFTDLNGRLQQRHYLAADGSGQIERIEYMDEHLPSPYKIEHYAVPRGRKRRILTRTEYPHQLSCATLPLLPFMATDNPHAAETCLRASCETLVFRESKTRCLNSPERPDVQDSSSTGNGSTDSIKPSVSQDERERTAEKLLAEEETTMFHHLNVTGRDLMAAQLPFLSRYRLEQALLAEVSDDGNDDDDDDDDDDNINSDGVPVEVMLTMFSEGDSSE